MDIDYDKKLNDILNDIYKNVLEQMKFSETKNNILATIIMASTVIYIRYYFYITTQLNNSILYKVIFFILFTMLIVSIYHVIKSFYPNLNNQELKNKTDENSLNIYFFLEISRLNSNRYLSLVMKKSNITSITNREQLLDLSNQIITLSKITKYKYECFKSSMVVFSYFLVFFSIFFSSLFWS